LWDYALRRRACAGDIAGLVPFEVQDSWHETLKQYFLMTPPPGHNKISWSQLLNADEALWRKISSKCEGVTKAVAEPQPTGSPAGAGIAIPTRFEKAWREMVFESDVRVHLHFLQGGGSSATSGDDVTKELARLRNRLQSAEDQLRVHKRKTTDDGGQKGRGQGKRRGRGKGDAKITTRSNMPDGLRGYQPKAPDGKSICYAFNLSGCPHKP